MKAPNHGRRVRVTTAGGMSMVGHLALATYPRRGTLDSGLVLLAEPAMTGFWDVLTTDRMKLEGCGGRHAEV